MVRTQQPDSFGTYLATETNQIMFLTRAGTIANGSSGFGKGCIHLRTDGSTSATHIYVNLGTVDSSTFTALTIA